MSSILHKAGWVMVSPEEWIENGLVEVVNGRIVSIGGNRPGARSVDHGPGVIMPALVNAHTHLSLAALRGRVGADKGFVDWVKDLISMRASVSPEEMTRAACEAAEDAKRTGTGFIAEVGPLEPGAFAIRRSGLEGTVFEEVLGNGPVPASAPNDDNGVGFSFAGHALHTTAPDALQALKALTRERGTVFSLHLAESEAEAQFLTGGDGVWAEFLHSRGIDFRRWDLKGDNPVERAERLGLLGTGTLAVHLLEVTGKDMEILADTGTSICLCPRSNLNLHERLPDIGALISAGLAPALGTDSLASVPSLSMFDEIAFTAQQYPDLSAETVIAMATVNGAGALGRNDSGTLAPGGRARLIYVDLEAASKRSAASLLVSDKHRLVEWI